MNWFLQNGFTELQPIGDSAEKVVNMLTALGQTAATAESCTGGMVASAIVSVPGASSVFENGFITYCDQAKHRILGVSEDTLSEHTAVSAEVAAEMADGCVKAGQADLGLSVTGLAGPGGGTKDKPVGLVYIGCCYHDRLLVQEYHFEGDREEIRCQAAAAALQLGYYCMRVR